MVGRPSALYAPPFCKSRWANGVVSDHGAQGGGAAGVPAGRRSQASYRRVVAAAALLCRRKGWCPIAGERPWSARLLLLWLNHYYARLMAGTISMGTVHSYMSALAQHHSSNGWRWCEPREDPRVRDLLAVMRSNAPATAPVQDREVMLDELRSFCASLDRGSHEQCALGFVATWTFWGMVRLSEILPGRVGDRPGVLWLWKHVRPQRLFYERGSNLPTGAGTSIQIPRPKVPGRGAAYASVRSTNNVACPMLWLGRLRWHVPGAAPDHPMLAGPECALPWFQREWTTRVGWRPGTSSFRAGGATQYALAGWTHDDIKTLGRWESTAFERYIRSHPDFRMALLHRNPGMGQPRPGPRSVRFAGMPGGQ